MIFQLYEYKNNFHDLGRCVKNENEFLQKKIKCLKGNELIASGNKKFAEEALKKNALIFQDQIENSVKQVDTQVERVAIVEIQIKEMHTYTGN